MSTRGTLKAAIEKAGTAFEACWAALAVIRAADEDETHSQLVTFQPRLAKAIHDLDCLHLQIKRRHRETIGRKQTIWSRTFAARLKQLAFYDQVIDKVREVGKTLGDAFAWLFYRDEKSLLEKHLAHQLVKHTPGGAGGRGELLSVERMQASNGHFMLYHGITTMLRIGDVSFVELKTFRVVGLGEIKSCEVSPGVMNMRLHMIGNKPLDSIFTRSPTSENSLPHVSARRPPEPTQKMKDQLERQLGAMAQAFRKGEEGAPTKMYSDSTRGGLVALCRALETKPAACQKCGDGLLLVGVRQDPTESFSSRLFAAVKGREKWDFADFDTHIRSLFDPTQDPAPGWNSVRVGVFSPAFFLGTTPFCWWQIDKVLIRRILFQQVLVVALYNPAFLVKRLQTAGFTVTRTGKEDKFTASKPMGEARMEVPEWDYFIRLITDHFMSEDSVLQIITEMESRMVQDKVKPMTKVMIALDYHQ